MKKLIFGTFALMTTVLTAQNTFPLSGNVGVGTTSPDQTLVVNGRISFDYGNGKSYNGFRRFGTKTEYYNIITGGSAVIHEFTGSNGAIMSLKNDGKIGIGTISPNDKLHVNGNTTLNIYHGTTPGHLNFRQGQPVTDVAIVTAQHGFATYNGLRINGTNGVSIGTNNGIERLRVDSAGRVGIGTISPNDKLHVNGDTTLNIYHGTRQGHLNFRQGQPVTDVAIVTAQHGFATFNGLRINGTNGVSIGTNNGMERLRVDSAGNVGIGTTNPDSKLTVKGKIHAEEVKIDLSVPAPDYVFTKEYKLLSIEEVQNHIQEKGHLPNIPSAKEMESNGVELGIMNMKLLEKIEELTLYTIEQEKRLQIQLKEIQELKKKQTANSLLEERLQNLEKIIVNQFNRRDEN